MKKKRDTEEYKNLLFQFNSRLGTDFDINSTTFFRDVSLATDKIAGWCDESQSDTVVYYPQTAYLPNQVQVPKSCYDDVIYVDFENIKIPVPGEYDEILKRYYGNEYMVPLHAASAHEYPFYKGQEQYFRFLGEEIED